MPKVVISIRVTQELKNRLIETANDHNRTFGFTCEKFLEYADGKCRKAKEGNRAGLDLLYLLGLSETSPNGSSNS